MATNPLHVIVGRLIGKTPAALDAEEQRVLATMQEKRPVSRDAADVADGSFPAAEHSFES